MKRIECSQSYFFKAKKKSQNKQFNFGGVCALNYITRVRT